MQKQTFEYYIDRYLQGSITPEELTVFRSFLQDPQNDEVLQQAMKNSWEEWGGHDLSFPDVLENLEQKLKAERMSRESPPVKPVPLYRRSWVRYAAAAILIAGISTVVMLSADMRTKSAPGAGPGIVSSGILPGTNKAVLTVDDKQIDLSSDKTGIAVGATIAYSDGEQLADAGKMIKLATPNGGQYQLTLPDGTKAWLNAASSISFPSVFNNGKRQIRVTGEVYLEVAQDRSKIFTVDIDGQSTVQVLGTSFNINAYGDEGNIQTTLISGSVKMLPAVINEKTAQVDQKATAVILKPGQQAIQFTQAAAEPIKILNIPNPDQILAWKNGIFEFNGANLRQVMKQLERWYNIRVVYSNNVPDIIFKGEFYRNVNLSDILEVLTEMGVKFRMEGKTLMVL
ncbi:FecR family protein [Pseudoflavitalea rhizosphaerae]|uniref:FecR family protein n=1 Tax=Pseudoflavitalea rhizosphaerae TaxID=1884793 RepID=UPI000F8EFEF1|nr:FecR family protein [Pseudoflavitalea rhizosphaerae]